MKETRKIGDMRVPQQGQQELLHIDTCYAKGLREMAYGEGLFSLI
jgi:hypothetical protein